MEFESLWDDSTWLPALSLPTLEWATPFLPLLGLPDLLLKQPEVLKGIHAQAINELQSQRQELGWALAKKGAMKKLTKEIVTQAFQNIAAQIGQEVAVNFKAWIIFHFICNEAQSAMFQWDVALNYAYLPENSRRGKRKISPPIELIQLLPEIWDLVDFERRKELDNHLMLVAPSPPNEQSPYEYMEKCYEATMISSALNQALTLKALQTIASRLDDTQRQEVVKWAQTQIQAMDNKNEYIRSQKLCADKYLQSNLINLNFPSVFN
ncbi:hypothetical protein NIES2111_61460 (plasmid) [Nostoc sp. NIES-2111]|nr:hypothetical protein NIES2111_61460 [Nostoc sp. NIES-2111]